MKLFMDTEISDRLSGFCVGIIALRRVDNRGSNSEADAFCRRCCTESCLLYKMNPTLFMNNGDRYESALKKHGFEGGDSELGEVTAHYIERLQGELSRKEKISENSLTELEGSEALLRINPILDMVHGAMLKFHVEIRAYDAESGNKNLRLRLADNGVRVVVEETVDKAPGFAKAEPPRMITELSENVFILIMGFEDMRKKVAAARNELARRLNSAFVGAVETGWLEGDCHEFVTEI